MSGRGTAGGIGFQSRVGAYVAALMLAGRRLETLSVNLIDTAKRILFETDDAIDDIVIETTEGNIYIQAKRTISLSDSDESEFAKVASQFVKQFRKGIVRDKQKRSLHPEKDRFILAVSSDAPATVKNKLKEALERNATEAATQLPEDLANPLSQLSSHIEKAWLVEEKAPIAASTKAEILKLCRVIEISESDERLMRTILGDVVAVSGDENALLSVLFEWSMDASARGIGGDVGGIRSYSSKKIRLAAPPNYRADIDKLKAYSQQVYDRLSRFRKLQTPEGEITVHRKVAEDVAQAAQETSFLVTGEPGAGKSAVLHLAAEFLRGSTVIMLSVEVTAQSLDGLRREIGLTNSVVDVLKAITTEQPSFLFIDALDAARGGLSEVTYRKLIEEVSVLENWRVIATVRSFDLRMGRELKRIFSGKPPVPSYADSTFVNISHIHIPLLDSTEIDQVSNKSKSVEIAISSGGQKLKELARNPFNLGLLTELLTNGIDASSLANVVSRGQLLEKYWAERVQVLGLKAEVGLSILVELMLERKTTNLPVPLVPAEAITILEELVQAGVLFDEDGRRIAFRHHVLFDYALARLALSPDQAKAFDRFSKEAADGLLIAPALGYWLEEQFRMNQGQKFWKVVVHLLSDSAVDPIIRAETARVCVDLCREVNSLQPLAELILVAPDDDNIVAVIHLIGSLLARASIGNTIIIDPWVKFSVLLDPIPSRLIFSLQALMTSLIEQENAKDFIQDLGKVARRLMDELISDEKLSNPLAPHILKLVTNTYETNVAESRIRLENILEPERFSRIGFIEVPWLAREISKIAAADGQFAIRIYDVVFKAKDFDRDLETSMNNSWILGLKSNAAQDFNMAEYSLAEAYPAILRANPMVGAEILGIVLDAEGLKHWRTEEKRYQFTALGKQFSILDDNSAIWAWNIEEEGGVDNYSKIYRSFQEWLISNSTSNFIEIIEKAIHIGTGISWRCIFSAVLGINSNQSLLLWDFVRHPQFFFCTSTCQSASALVAHLYPFLSAQQKKEFEHSILDFDCSSFVEPDNTKGAVCRRVFGAIGINNLQTPEAQQLIQNAIEKGEAVSNHDPFRVEVSSRSLGRHEWIRDDITLPINNEALSLEEQLVQALAELKSSASSEMTDRIVSLCSELERLANEEGISSDVNQTVCDTLARACEDLLMLEQLESQNKQFAIRLLIVLAQHQLPEANADVERDFSENLAWGSPSPRIRVADAISSIMQQPDLWPQLAATVKNLLLYDLHPVVRYMIARKLNTLWNTSRDEMWSLIEEISATEQNRGVLKSLIHVLWRLSGAAPDRVEALFISIFDRVHPEIKKDENFVEMLVHYAIIKNSASAYTRLTQLIENFSEDDRSVMAALHDIRAHLIRGYDDKESDAVYSQRSRLFLMQLLDQVEPVVREWIARGGHPSEKERSAIKIVDSIADQILFATGSSRHSDLVIKDVSAQNAFLQDNQVIIRRVINHGTPRAIHHILETIESFMPANPGLCFDLMADALLRREGVARYEYESLGVGLFIKLVGLYLADYRDLFDDDARRKKLIDCISIFVEAGWHEARRLFERLPELLS